MASDSVFEVRVGAPGNVLEVRVGNVEMDVPRSVGYFGGLVAAVSLGIIEPPLALFIAAVPAFKILTHSALPRSVRAIGEIFEGAAKPVGGDAEGVIQIEDEQRERSDVVDAGRRTTRRTPPKRSAGSRAR